MVKRRVVIVSRTAVNRHLKPIVAHITTTARERALPTYVEVEPTRESALSETSFIVCHELSTLDWDILEGPIGRFDLETIFKMREALAIAVGAKDLPALPR